MRGSGKDWCSEHQCTQYECENRKRTNTNRARQYGVTLAASGLGTRRAHCQDPLRPSERHREARYFPNANIGTTRTERAVGRPNALRLRFIPAFPHHY